jgi:acyl-coenzyme A synthetase/AMP-(fatty) acid ligase
MTGSLSVGLINLTRDEVEERISLLSGVLQRLSTKIPKGRFAPLLVDFTVDSHLLLAAASRVSLNCALIDAALPSNQVKLQLRQLNANVIYYLPSANPVPIPIWSGIRYQNLESVKFGHHSSSKSSSQNCVVLFSSGSTGEPKGVVLAWDTIHEILASNYSQQASQQAKPRVLNLQPLNWTVGFFHAISLNASVELLSINPLEMTIRQLIERIRIAKAERIYLGANFARLFAKALDGYTGQPLESVTRFVIGSGAITWELVNRFKRILPEGAEFVHSYGSTEAVGMLASRWSMNNIPKSGRVSLGKLSDANGTCLQESEQPGRYEVLATERIGKRYLATNYPTQQFFTLPDGTHCWKSGDLVSVDGETQEIYFEGRVDDIVKNSDHLVSLFKVEAEINSMRGVEMVAVRQVVVDNREVIVAFVQISKADSRSEARIISSLRKKLPSYSIPQKIVICDEIPLTNRGKPDNQKLFELLA